MKLDARELLSPERLDALADQFDPARAAPWGRRTDPGDTIWMGVIDSQGVAVSFIQSIYHEFGSGVVLPESGVNWQNRGASFSLDPTHINTLEPGKKPFHTLNPALARLDDGRLVVYGTMGGDGQPQTQATIFSRMRHFGDTPQQAIARPRWLLGRTWGKASDSLRLESRFDPAVVAQLDAPGPGLLTVADFLFADAASARVLMSALRARAAAQGQGMLVMALNRRHRLQAGYVTPLGGGADRFFDGELRAMYNWRFGPQNALRRAQF